MTVEIKSGGAWRTITAPEVKSGGVWRAIQTIEVRSGGVWRTVFEVASGGAPSGTNIVVTSTRSGPVGSGCAFQSDGTIDEVGPLATDRRLLGLDDNSVSHTGEWKGTIDPVVGSEWEIACTSMVSGVWDIKAANLGVFIALSSERIWKEQRTVIEGVGTDTATGNFRIREIADTGNFVDFTMKGTAIRT